jgi:hypothetical protein
LREVRLMNLRKRLGRKGRVELHILSENLRQLVMERNCLKTTERDLKQLQLVFITVNKELEDKFPTLVG